MNNAACRVGCLALVGYRGTGKSTVGRILARRLNMPFVDADVSLESKLSRSIRSIFEDLGEPAFRDWEEQILAELTSGPAAVIATGGGVVLRETNRRMLRACGRVIWLTAEPALLARRLQADQMAGAGRPALTAAGTLNEIATVLANRTPLYQEVADVVISTDGLEPEQVADSALAALGEFERSMKEIL